MIKRKDDSEKKVRVTSEDLTKIKGLHKQGWSLADIAGEVGFHRHTIRKHLQEKYTDIVAEAARTQVLAEELRNHFKQLKAFAANDLKSRMDVSVPGLKKPGKPRTSGPINISGLLGLPCKGTALSMLDEWVRMYRPAPKEDHLLKSLRRHTKDLGLWISWDSWRRKVSAYERASSYLWTWLEERLEEALLESIDPRRAVQIMRWLFGNMLRIAGGGKQDDLGTFRRIVYDPAGATVGRDQEKDTDGSMASFEFLSGILKEVQSLNQWEELRSATVELESRKSQLELRRVAKVIDHALVSIELMGAFGGHCELCPV